VRGMPSAEAILDGLTAIANDWRGLAIGWHVLLTAAIVGMFAGWRPTNRTAAGLLIMPLVSVSVLAWSSGNPFNTATFAALALALGSILRRLSSRPVRVSQPWLVAAGALLLTFAWVYPHFLHARTWAEYIFAAPLGLIPCPTLAAVIGVTLILGLLESRAWSLTVAVMGLAYGAIGIFRLGVRIDVALLAGAALLALTALGGIPAPLDHRHHRRTGQPPSAL
jgi:hypothetical protein